MSVRLSFLRLCSIPRRSVCSHSLFHYRRFSCSIPPPPPSDPRSSLRASFTLPTEGNEKEPEADEIMGDDLKRDKETDANHHHHHHHREQTEYSSTTTTEAGEAEGADKARPQGLEAFVLALKLRSLEWVPEHMSGGFREREFLRGAEFALRRVVSLISDGEFDLLRGLVRSRLIEHIQTTNELYRASMGANWTFKIIDVLDSYVREANLLRKQDSSGPSILVMHVISRVKMESVHPLVGEPVVSIENFGMTFLRTVGLGSDGTIHDQLDPIFADLESEPDHWKIAEISI